MVTQRVEIELPESVYRQLALIAEETEQPIEVLAAQSVIGNLPPLANSVSPELRSDLLRMQALETEALLEIAQAEADPGSYQYQVELLEKNENGSITEVERQEMSALRQSADRMMLRKAYAWSILRWRGQRVPTLQELSIPQ